MIRFLLYLNLVLPVISEVSTSHAPDWNSTWCNWANMRANIVRDMLYIDGGELWWLTGDGVNANNSESSGYFYYLNLSLKFNTTDSNWSNLFRPMEKDSFDLSRRGGVMFADDDGWYLYGGTTRNTASRPPPPAGTVLGYKPYIWEDSTGTALRDFVNDTLDPSVTNQISNGAGVSAPSEKVGFYFSGMRSKNWGMVYDDSANNITANTLVMANMTVADNVQWTNSSLPSYIPSRADAELVWVPISHDGILLAIGGVIYPVDVFRFLKDTQKLESEQASPKFMETVSIYDIHSQQWFLQETTGEIPPQRTKFCSVVASAPDNSSHNIYIYGGTEGLDKADPPFEDVYVLSIPSFQWVKVYSGDEAYGRSGHKCFKTHPDQMSVIGGAKVMLSKCLEGGMIRIFNLNTLEFQNTYSPTDWSEYRVPGKISSRIGGDSKGGATKTAPESWTNSSLADIFKTTYTKSLQTWDPYMKGEGNTPKSDGFPQWAGAVIGVIVGLATIFIVLGLWFLRRHRRKRADDENTTMELDGDSKKPPELGSEQVHEMDIRGGTRIELPTDYNNQSSTVQRSELPAGDPKCAVDNEDNGATKMRPLDANAED